MENWKEIPGWEHYKISSNGRVLGKRGEKKPTETNDGRLVYCLSNKGKRKTYLAHQLVAMAFLDHIPNGHEVVVDHINKNPKDNRLDNLQLVSNRHNTSKDKKDPGIRFYKNGWEAYTKNSGRQIYIGRYKSMDEAKNARLRYLKENFPNERIYF